MALTVLFIGIAFTTLVSTLAGALALRSIGIGVPRIDLGVWAPKIRFAIAGSDISLSPWMLSGSSTFKDFGNADLYGDCPGKLLSSFGRIVRALLALVGPLAVLAIALLFAGWEALLAFGSGFAQVVVGALHPFSHAQAYLAAFVNVAAQSPVSSIGIVLAKLAAFSLLPIPPLSGGRALIELFRPRDSAYGTIAALVQKVGTVAVFFIAAMWLAAAGWWLVHGGAI